MTETTHTLWEGRASAPPAPRPHDLTLSLFGATAMLISAAFCTITIWTMSPFFVTAYGLMVFGFGVYFCFGRRVARRLGWRKRAYRVTDEAILITGRGQTRTVPREDLSNLRWIAHKRGTVSLWGSVSGGAQEALLESLDPQASPRELLGG